MDENDRPDPEKRKEGGLGRHWIPRSVLFYSALALIVIAAILFFVNNSRHSETSPMLRDLVREGDGLTWAVVLSIATAVILLITWAIMRKKK